MESFLNKLKQEYSVIEKKHKLPGFYEMNKEFDIEKLQEKETDFLLREVRRAMIEKNAAYLRFVEMFQNPSNAPMFFLALVRNLGNSSKKILDEMYLALGKFEIRSIALDNEYNEEKEAEFVKELFREWQEIKRRFSQLSKDLNDSWERKAEKRDKGYLG